MTDLPTLTIATPFEDVSALTDNFATRVDESQIMLPYNEPVEEGLALHFTVLLLDGSVAFEGKGRSTGTHDNGEDFPPEYRYDVVLDSLELSGMSEVMFERFLQARQSQMEGDPGTGEVDVNQLADAGGGGSFEEEAPADLPTEARPIEASAPMEAVEALEDAPSEEAAAEEDWQPEGEFAEQVPTQAVHLDDLAARAVPSAPPPAPVRSAPPPAVPSAPPAAAARPAPPAAARPSPPQRPPGTLPAMHTFDHGILTRPSTSAGWAPEVVARPEPAQSSGLFDYQGGLPRPASPPRPEMADEQRVAAAPSPAAPWSTAASA